jgi:serine/threonine protein kinase
MNYPLISEYVEAIKAAEDNFEQLKYLRPVLDDDGQPVMTSGNFAVVFKMKDEMTGKFHAVKCFLREQEGRAEAYRQIAEELEYVSSTFLTPIKYLDKELFVDTSNSDESEFPVLLMDWVEGQTLDKYIREHIDDQYDLSLLAYQFSRLAMWLLPQPFAHGDLKPDNILVKKDGTLVLVDYDGMYVPAMKGQKARELGSPDFRHPSRTEIDFDEHIDDFSLVSILLSLKAIALQPELLGQYGASDRLFFSEKDYRDISQCQIMKELFPSSDSELNVLMGLFILSLEKTNLNKVSYRLLILGRPQKPEMSEKEIDAFIKDWEYEHAFDFVEVSWMYQGFIKGYKRMYTSYEYCYYRGGAEQALIFERENGEKTIVYNLGNFTIDQINESKNSLSIDLRRSGEYLLCDHGLYDIIENDTSLISTEEYKGSFISTMVEKDCPDKTADYKFEKTWSLSEFINLHGKMYVEQRKNNVTGEEFPSLLFVDDIGREIHALVFENIEHMILYDVLKNADVLRIGSAPSQYYTPSYYYLYNKSFDFWLPGMSI